MNSTILRQGPGNLLKASVANVPKQFEVWVVDQELSRKHSIPPTPADPSKPYRPFIILSPNSANSSGSDIVCLPLSTKQFQKMFEVFISTSEGIREDSYVKCYQPQTLHTDYLYGPVAYIKNAQIHEDIQEKLKEFLDIP